MCKTILFFGQTDGFECAPEYKLVIKNGTVFAPPNLREMVLPVFRMTYGHMEYYVCDHIWVFPGTPSVWARRSHNNDNSESKLELFYNSFCYLVFSYSFGKLYRSVQFLY